MVALYSLLALVIGYLLGSISFAVLIGRAHGIDIFKHGSGNPGATNVKRVLGSKAGNLCFILDALKGFLAAIWPLLLLTEGQSPALVAIFGGAGAILGHSLSIFLGFRGGKGVATTIGTLLAILPVAIGLGLILWLIVFSLTRYVSLASILMGLALPLLALALGAAPAKVGFAVLIAVVILVR
ncbi:MAG: glycerol-3-phosphate 1-O-acyltransferase PlsY, partial [Verrucomicrobiota bacterium]